MENIQILATENSPEINFDFENSRFFISGMSYLEDAKDFYDPLTEKIENHFANNDFDVAEFTFEVSYFNSSSARIYFRLFEQLDRLAKDGANVNIIWRHLEDDDNMEEQGEDLGEDLEHASFQLVSF
jgi:hypothetical protein